MAEALKCLYCGVRRFLSLDVFLDDGGLAVADDTVSANPVVQCPCCKRFYEIVGDGDESGKYALKLVTATSDIVNLRKL